MLIVCRFVHLAVRQCAHCTGPIHASGTLDPEIGRDLVALNRCPCRGKIVGNAKLETGAITQGDDALQRSFSKGTRIGHHRAPMTLEDIHEVERLESGREGSMGCLGSGEIRPQKHHDADAYGGPFPHGFARSQGPGSTGRRPALNSK